MSENLLGFDIKAIATQDMIVDKTDIEIVEKDKPKKSRKKVDVVVSDKEEELPMVYSNTPYEKTYNDSMQMLNSVVVQSDIVASELKQEFDSIRASKTLSKKYEYIPAMGTSIGSLLKTKLDAIKEMNKVITDSHNLDLKRVKDMKMAAIAGGNDDKTIMDAYTQMISMPINALPVQYSTPYELTGPGMSYMMEGSSMSPAPELTPEQLAMRLEHDPNIKTVVVYDQATGGRYFDVMNIRTHESIPGMPRPNPMFMEDITLDLHNKIARNANLNETYPLIIVGNNSINLY